MSTAWPDPSPTRTVLRAALRPAVAAVLVALGAVLTGFTARDTVLAVLATAAVVLSLGVLTQGDEHVWPEEGRETGDGTRLDVTALTWSLFGRDGHVSEAAVRRLRLDATRRLARRGVVLPRGLAAAGRTPQDEAEREAHALLGDRAWRALTTRGGWLPSLADVAHCVDVIEALDPRTPDRRDP